MGLYGNMLTHFAGQFRYFTYFNMTPNVNSGYTIDSSVPVKKLRGVLQNSTSDIVDSNGLLATNNNEYLWTPAGTELQVGFFVQFDDTIFRIIPSNDWTFEGGFNRYTISRLIGDNGTPNPGTFTTGIGGTQL